MELFSPTRVSVDMERSAREVELSPTTVESEAKDEMELVAFLCNFGLEKTKEEAESAREKVCSGMLEK